jgi:hypothetical protein
MSTSWTAVEDAVRAWVLTGSGLDNEHVIWADQDGPRPGLPFVTIKIGDLSPVGPADLVPDTDLARAAGQEIRRTVTQLFEFTASVQAFTTPTTGTAAARSLLARVHTAVRLPTVNDALNLAGIAPFDVGKVQNLSAVLGQGFEGRASLEVRFYAQESLAENLGYITSIEIENTSASTIFTVPS